MLSENANFFHCSALMLDTCGLTSVFCSRGVKNSGLLRPSVRRTSTRKLLWDDRTVKLKVYLWYGTPTWMVWLSTSLLMSGSPSTVTGTCTKLSTLVHEMWWQIRMQRIKTHAQYRRQVRKLDLWQYSTVLSRLLLQQVKNEVFALEK